MGNVIRNIAMAGALMGAAAGCAETHGPGTLATPERGCLPTESSVVLDTNGDHFDYGIQDVSFGDSEGPTRGIRDTLRVEAVGVTGTSSVTEVVFSGDHSFVISKVKGLPFDETMQGNRIARDEFRVQMDELRDAEDDKTHTLSFEVREADLGADVIVKPADDPSEGVTVSLSQDCGRQAPVND